MQLGPPQGCRLAVESIAIEHFAPTDTDAAPTVYVIVIACVSPSLHAQDGSLCLRAHAHGYLFIPWLFLL
jgi:hypothetical protein